ncbi:MAG: hypothetical protein Q4G40_12375 [Brachybacterium sp.]|nr:hypothetical protein [Brachybacterium sp.]
MSPAPLALALPLLVIYLPHALALTVVDVREHRLPNRIVVSLTVWMLLLVALAALMQPAWRSVVVVALVLALATAVLGIGIALLAPGVIGMGDAKTAPVVVLVAAALGADVLLAALLGIALLGGAAGLIAGVITGTLRTRIPYGPVLVIGPFLGLLGAPLVRSALGHA